MRPKVIRVNICIDISIHILINIFILTKKERAHNGQRHN